MCSPLLVEFHDIVRSRGANIEMISVATSEPGDEDWLRAIAEDKLTWTQLNDAHSRGAMPLDVRYAISGVPACLLISPEGIILYKDHPAFVISKIKELFKL
jgi:hypothetical protein